MKGAVHSKLGFLQELLKHYGGAEQGSKRSRSSSASGQDNSLFKRLDKDVQALVQPYLDSKYLVHSKDKAEKSFQLVFRKSGMSFRSWLRNWLRQLVNNHAHGMAPARSKPVT